MEIKTYLALAAMFVAVFMFSAFADDVNTESTAVNAASEVEHVFVADTSPPAEAVRDVTAIYVDMQAWVRERRGLPVLNVRGQPVKAVYQLDGYSQVQIKPKIITAHFAVPGAIAFTGLASDHFARADV